MIESTEKPKSSDLVSSKTPEFNLPEIYGPGASKHLIANKIADNTQASSNAINDCLPQMTIFDSKAAAEMPTKVASADVKNPLASDKSKAVVQSAGNYESTDPRLQNPDNGKPPEAVADVYFQYGTDGTVKVGPKSTETVNVKLTNHSESIGGTINGVTGTVNFEQNPRAEQVAPTLQPGDTKDFGTVTTYQIDYTNGKNGSLGSTEVHATWTHSQTLTEQENGQILPTTHDDQEITGTLNGKVGGNSGDLTGTVSRSSESNQVKGQISVEDNNGNRVNVSAPDMTVGGTLNNKPFGNQAPGNQ